METMQILVYVLYVLSGLAVLAMLVLRPFLKKYAARDYEARIAREFSLAYGIVLFAILTLFGFLITMPLSGEWVLPAFSFVLAVIVAFTLYLVNAMREVLSRCKKLQQ